MGHSDNPRHLHQLAANDCHHNQVFILKKVDDDTALLGTIVDKDENMRSIKALLRPSIRGLLKGYKPGDIVARLDFDPYEHSLKNVATHILATAQTEAALRTAVKAGLIYVSHDWMADGTDFDFTGTKLKMGDEQLWRAGQTLRIRTPVPAKIRLLRNGREVALGDGYEFQYDVWQPSVYRAELWLDLGGEVRPWIYSNPIYLHLPRTKSQ